MGHQISLRSRLSVVLLGLVMVAVVTIGFARTVLAASFTVSPTSGLAGSAVSVAGTGFAPNAPVSLFFAGIPLTTTNADPSGVIGTTFTVPEVPGGGYIVFATDAGGTFLASAEFTIPGPAFTVTPTQGVAGTVVSVVTGGVLPTSSLSLDFSGIAEGSFSSDSSGIVKASFIVPNEPPGGYLVDATTASSAFFASVVFTVLPADSTPPTLTCSATPSVLSPPDHRLVDVTATVIVTDTGSGPAGFRLDSVTSNEPDNGLGDGDQPSDIQGFVVGTSDVSGQLRAERSGLGNGRVYTLTFTGFDVAGNSAQCSIRVSVPHDMG